MSDPVSVFNCSPSQTRLWLLEQLGRGGRSLVVRAPLGLPAAVDHDQVTHAVRALIARHEALRTTFDELDGQPVQRVHRPEHLCCRVEAVNRPSPNLTEPFDLRRGPLIRAQLVRSEQGAQLLLAFHHIIVDGWSIQVIQDDLAALVDGRPLPDLRVQYADYAGWHLARLLELAPDRLGWWKEQFADYTTPPPLFPALGSKSPTARGIRLARTVESELTDRVRELARARDATPFAVLLAAFGMAIHTLTGRHDLVVGCPVAGRTHSDLDGVVGFFVNTLPIRLHLDGSAFPELVDNVRELWVEAFDRQDIPYELISSTVRQDQTTQRTPLFEAMFNYLEGTALPRRSRARRPAGSERTSVTSGTHSDLELYALDFGDELQLELVYADGTVGAQTAHVLLDLIMKVLAGSQQSLAERAPEPHTPAAEPEHGNLVDAFLGVAGRNAERLAVHDGIRSWTYAELRDRALGLAAAVGDGSGRRVGILARHDAYAVSAIVGTLCSGAAYVPLDPRWPLARLTSIIDDAALEMIMIDPGLDDLRSQLSANLRGLTCVDLTTRANPCSARPIDQDALAYLIYTSGTTARPKGVMQSHDHVLGNALTYARSINLSGDDRVSMLPGFGTDAGVMDLFGALLAGACLHPIDLHPGEPASVTFDELPEVLTGRGITVLHSTPSVFRQLTSELDQRAHQPAQSALTAIRAVVLGGEPAVRADLEGFQRHMPADAVLVNGYGPTESTMALQFFAGHSTALAGDAVPLGTSVAGMAVSVQASDGTTTPAGQVGELVLNGSRLALGYWQLPDDTARAFAGGRYRSGDLVRVHADGALTFAGRSDDQLKVRGYRIEPAEIEAALRRQPGVLAAAVTAADQLTAYLVASPGSQLSPRRLRRSLRRELPDAMVPARYVTVDLLPLTTSGKVDRQALADIPSRPIREKSGAATPRSAAEQALAEIWAEVLDVDESEIGATDTFFDLGGHSLLLTQVAARLAHRLRVKVPLRVLFDNPRLSELAVRVEAESAAVQPDTDGQAGLEQPIAPRTSPGPYPLSSSQSRLWFIEELSPGLSTYTMTTTISVPAGTPADHVQSALDELVARHESLRTTFLTVEGQPRQQIAATLRLRLGVTRVDALDHAAAVLCREEIGRRLASTAFDLRRGPLIRAHFVDSGQHAAGMLFLALHHIVADGWSMSLLRRECALLLAARRDRRDSPLPALPLQYADYAIWESRLKRRSSAIDWWTEELAGAPQRIDLPSDRPRPATPTFRGSLVSQPFPAELVAGCRALARKGRTTPFTVYLAAFAAILHRWSGQHDLVVGTPVAGRTRVETEDIVGLFVNSLPLRLRPDSAQPFADFVAAVREVVAGALDNQEVPLEEIVRRVAPQRRLAYAPLFQVMFAVGGAREDVGASGVTHTSTAKFDLSMTVDDGAVPTIYLEYAADLFDEMAPRCLLEAMVTLLAAVTAEPTCPLGKLPVGREPDIDVTDLPLVRPVLPRGPGCAVVGADKSTSYDDLHVMVDRFAGRLTDHDVAPGSIVAVDLPRGPELLAAVWAIREFGCAFFLLDPIWPERRRQELLERAHVAFILGPDLACHPDHEPDLQLSGGYLVSTSGSTGRPKIVAVPGRAVDAQVAALATAYQLTEVDHVLQFAALGFDVAIEEILPTLAVGATLHFGPTDAAPTFAELDEICAPGGVTVLNLPASYWQEWVGYLGQHRHGVPAGLRLVVTGSEPVSPRAVSQWQALTPGCRLLIAYGTSETTITNTLFAPDVDRAWADEERVPIGRALPNARVLVVDPNGRVLPPPALGELVVEGECVALGYRGEPELTARRFVETSGGRRRYLTGDLGRARFDGQLELIGRLDDQIKCAGHRIEPAEIEAALLRQPGVAAAAVAVRALPNERSKLVAYVVTTSEPLDTNPLRTALLAELPEYLVPAAFVVLDSLPRSEGGKLDRSLLPAPPEAPAAPAGPEPSGSIEQLVADIWAQTLTLPRSVICADSNFFGLGGDSILSLQVAWRLGAAGWPVSLKDLFAHQTVANLAAALPNGTTVERAKVDDEHGDGVPLTPIQKWQLGLDSPHPQHDNQSVLLVLGSSVTVEALRAALTAVMVTHDALRLRFELIDQEWRAHINPGPVEEPHLTVHPSGADLASVAARSHAALDLAAGPVFRAELLPGSPDRLLLIAHHLVMDVVSWQIIISDLGAALAQHAAGAAPQLPPVPTSWSSWARRLSSWAQGDQAAEQARWWLAAAPDLTSCVRLSAELPAGLAGDEDVVRATLDGSDTAHLLSALRELDARIDEALVAAIALAAVTVAAATPSALTPAGAWLPIDVEGHGREPIAPDLDLSRTVGWFTTLRAVTVPVGEAVGEVLAATTAALRGMPQHGIAYGAARWLRPVDDALARALRSQPAAEVSINYLGRLDSGAATGASLVRPDGSAPGPARDPEAARPYALDVVAGLRDGELVIWLSHAGQQPGKELAEAVALRCLALLRELAQVQPPDEPEKHEINHRLTPMQEAMLYSPEATQDSGVYVEQSVLELPPGCDHHRLRQAWEQAVRRHGILRTRFYEHADGERVQQVLPRVRLPWRVVDWRHLPPDEAQLRLDGLLAEDRRRGFAIDQAPLMRLVVIQLSAGDRMVWSHHHALLDGWSATALLDELADRSAEPVAVRPFSDYLDWLDAREPKADREYWTGQLAGRPDAPVMPVHDVGTAQPRARALAVGLPESERMALAERARSLCVGVATLAHAAWALVLAEYFGSEDVTFGVTASGRPAELAGADRMIGLFITSHPVRVRIPSSTPLAAWATELAAQEATSRDHAHAGLVAIGRWAGVPAGSPLFESLLVVENYRRQAGRPGPAEPGVIREIGVREIPDVPLSVVVAPDIGLSMVFDARRFETRWIGDLLQAFRSTLSALVAASDDTPVVRLRVLRERVRERAIAANDTSRPLPDRTLGAQWRASARQNAQAVAVTDSDGRSISYAELAADADRVTARLLAAGARSGDLVGLAGHRSAELAAAVLGIVQAGCAYVPLDTTYPDDRLQFMIADTGMRLALAETQLFDRLPASVHPLPLAEVSDPQPAIARAESDKSVEDAAYVMYTSGSTGQPKGVVVPHRAVTRLVVNTDYCPLGPRDVVALASTFSFDASTFEMWGALLNGARLAPIDTDTMLSPLALANALRDQQVTTLFITTAVFNAIATEQPDAFASLSTVMFGGERVDPRSVRRVLEAGPPRRLLHVYGPTEATTFSSWYEVTDVPEGAATVPIGGPIANTELLILDARGEPVLAGVEGELCIGGSGLAVGYLNDAELTARRFVPHPWHAERRIYRTGDVVLRRSDGAIEIRGRLDGQIKIRGFRIEPGEVEAQLCAAPGVAAAVVVPRRESNEVHFLAAYAVPEPGARLDPDHLRTFLRARLPEHLVPNALVIMDALPLNPNGKIDRARLPDPRTADRLHDQPATETEEAIARIWSAVLKIEQSALGRDHDFFDLGGHSLLLTQVASRLRTELEVEVPLRSLFGVRRLGDLALLVDGSVRIQSSGIDVLDRHAHRAEIDDGGRLLVPPALHERLTTGGIPR